MQALIDRRVDDGGCLNIRGSQKLILSIIIIVYRASREPLNLVISGQSDLSDGVDNKLQSLFSFKTVIAHQRYQKSISSKFSLRERGKL